MMELASVMVDVMVMLVPKEGMTQEKRLMGGTMPPSFECFSEDTLKTSCSEN